MKVLAFLQRWSSPIRIKLAIVLTLVIGAISLFIFIYFPSRLEQQAMKAIADKAHSITAMTAFSTSTALLFEDHDAVEEVLKSVRQDKDLVYLVVLTETGQTFAAFNRHNAEQADFRQTIPGRPVSPDGTIYKTMTPILNNGRAIGHLYVGLSLKDLRVAIGQSRTTIAFVSCLVFLIGMIAVLGISTVVTGPLSQMVDTVEHIAKGDLTQRAAVYAHDEVGHLARSFNLMVENLETAHRALETANQTLEKRVAERTDALQQEINERKRVEEALRTSEQRYRLLFERNLAGVYCSTRDGRILDCNDAFARLFGYASREEILTHQAQELYQHEADRNAFLARLQEQRTLTGFEMCLQRKDGRPVWVLETTSLIPDEHGALTLLEGTIIDITERKQAEEERLKFSKLESIGLLAGGIAHDFNNILTGVLGYISFAKMDVNPDDPVFGRLTEAENACMQAKSLTQQLLTFAKGGAPIKQMTSIAALLIESATFALRGSNVRCEWAIPENLWTVDVDAGQIRQVIQNLVINADQAMSDGGVLTIRCANVPLGAATTIQGVSLSAGFYVKLSIIDQGIGIPADQLLKIFDPYFTTKQTGTGLGLTTAYTIIKRHGGMITVDSAPGMGATFELYLPASSTVRSSFDTLPLLDGESRPQEGQGKILVMDDEATVRELTVQSLIQCGYSVTGACDGSEALALYQRALEADQPFDAVIMDLTVPGGMGGKEAIDRLRTIDPHVKAIVSSGYSNDPVMADFKRYGFRGMVAKPYRVIDLAEVVQQVILGQESVPS